MKKSYFHFLVLIVLILQGCTFKPYGDEFVKIDPTGKLPNIEINLNLAKDTIFIEKQQKLTFAYAPDGNQVIWAKFIINGREAVVKKDASGAIKLDWNIDCNAGEIYPIELQIFAKSQTGSLADKINAEGFLMTRKWIMVVGQYSQLTSKITRTAFIDGSLQIEWDKFIGQNFKNYKVYKIIDYGSNDIIKLVATITSRVQTSVIDNTYHGENSVYYIVTNDDIKGDYYNIKGPLPIVSATNTPNGSILLNWNKPGFYKNLKGYRISYLDEKGIVQNVIDLNDTDINSYTIPNPIFGFNYAFYLTMLPLTDNYYDDLYATLNLSSKLNASYGIPTPTFKLALGGLAPISYLMNDTVGIQIFDNQKLSTVRKLKYIDKIINFDVSSNNKYLVAVPQFDKKIYFEDLINPVNSKLIDLSKTFTFTGNIASVSDIGTGIVLDNHAVMFDYINEIRLADVYLDNIGMYTNKISPSGNFFFCETYIGYEYFQYKNKQIIRLQRVDNKNGDKMILGDYLPGVNEKMVRAFANRVEIVDCNTWTVEKQWQLADPVSDV